jgi:hypothetical protein
MNQFWKRYTRQNPCPFCSHPDWCEYSADGAFAICMRNQVGAIKETKNGGYLHRLKDSPYTGCRVLRIAPRTPPSARFEAIARHCYDALQDDARAVLADELGLSYVSLVRLRTGWSKEYNAYTFPMRNAAGGITGIRLRRPDGYKLSVTGGKSGIFIPTDTPWSGRLLITEGPTDCAAMTDLGFTCIGRPDCQSCVGLVFELVRQRRYQDVVVVGDGDAPGQRGAEALASTLRAVCGHVRIIFPPPGTKDARQWVNCGGTHEDVEAVIESAHLITMPVKAALYA